MALVVGFAQLARVAGAGVVIGPIAEWDFAHFRARNLQGVPIDFGEFQPAHRADFDFVTGVDYGTLQVIDPGDFGHAHLVQSGDLAEIVARLHGICGQSGRRGTAQFELLAAGYLFEAQFLTDENTIIGQTVEAVQFGYLDAIAQGDGGEGFARFYHVHSFFERRRAQAEFLPGLYRVVCQVVELTQQTEADVEAQGDLRKGVAGADGIFSRFFCRGWWRIAIRRSGWPGVLVMCLGCGAGLGFDD